LSAVLSECGRYRYSLTRYLDLDGDESVCTFVMLNPSTADATQNDPTIRRCLGFARAWGYGRLKVVNLYAFRTTDPGFLWLQDDPVGPENDHAISLAFGASDLIVAAWGAHARVVRLAQFAETFRGWRLHALGVTKHGAPRHPLYLRADTTPERYYLRLPQQSHPKSDSDAPARVALGQEPTA
jgi:hypothetical protein